MPAFLDMVKAAERGEVKGVDLRLPFCNVHAEKGEDASLARAT